MPARQPGDNDSFALGIAAGWVQVNNAKARDTGAIRQRLSVLAIQDVTDIAVAILLETGMENETINGSDTLNVTVRSPTLDFARQVEEKVGVSDVGAVWERINASSLLRNKPAA
ncbi:hypothetical protein HRbin36_01580 [bacterium HR36]|nr:hypothetical protein HRbin36_01580 [bacterium HR36]